MDLQLHPLDATSDAHLLRYCTLWNLAWPEDPRAVAELQFDIEIEPRARRWCVEPDAGVVDVQRLRWNADNAPPICWIGLAPELHARESYLPLLQACARTARDWGFEELRVGCWDREQVLADVLAEHGFRIAEEEVHVALQVAGAPVDERPAPEGVRLTTLAHEPELRAAAWECFCEAGTDVPGDEPLAFPSYERWLRERSAPWAADDSCFLAVDTDDLVVGFAEMERFELPGDVAWHGFTAVRPAWRGRGIASALKARTIAWARSQGIRELRTENEIGNAPMRHINARYGYQRLAVRSDWRGPVEQLAR